MVLVLSSLVTVYPVLLTQQSSTHQDRGKPRLEFPLLNILSSPEVVVALVLALVLVLVEAGVELVDLELEAD